MRLNYSYDDAGRIVTRSYPAESTSDVGYTYDATSGGNAGKGRLTGVSDAAGAVSYQYDLPGRVSRETRTIGSQSYATAYQWNDAGNLIGVTY